MSKAVVWDEGKGQREQICAFLIGDKMLTPTVSSVVKVPQLIKSAI